MDILSLNVCALHGCSAGRVQKRVSDPFGVTDSYEQPFDLQPVLLNHRAASPAPAGLDFKKPFLECPSEGLRESPSGKRLCLARRGPEFHSLAPTHTTKTETITTSTTQGRQFRKKINAVKPVKEQQNWTRLLSHGRCHMSREILRKNTVGVGLELLAPRAKAVWHHEGDSASLSWCCQHWE